MCLFQRYKGFKKTHHKKYILFSVRLNREGIIKILKYFVRSIFAKYQKKNRSQWAKFEHGVVGKTQRSSENLANF